MDRPQRDNPLACLLLVGAAALVAACLAFSWYRTEVQAEVWRREGIEMSTWEVWMGAKPAERKLTP